MPPPVRNRSCVPVATGGFRWHPEVLRFPVGWMLPSGTVALASRTSPQRQTLGHGRSECPMAHTRCPCGRRGSMPKHTSVDPSPLTRRCAAIPGAYPVHSSHCLLPDMTTSDLERRLPCRTTGPEGPNPLTVSEDSARSAATRKLQLGRGRPPEGGDHHQTRLSSRSSMKGSAWA